MPRMSALGSVGTDRGAFNVLEGNHALRNFTSFRFCSVRKLPSITQARLAVIADCHLMFNPSWYRICRKGQRQS